MTILPIIAGSAAVLLVAYVTYGRLLTRWLGVDDARVTPAVELDDGNDFCPAGAPVVLGGHFTAIAAAGPVVGPILAGLLFGWLPALIWILVGSIFIGGVHDAGALLASVRHRATSITQVVREHLSRPAYVTFLAFVYLSLIYVVIAFADVTASTFARLQSLPMTVDGVPQTFRLNGGAVAIGATAYLLLSVALGLVLRHTRVKAWAGVAVACALLVATIAAAPTMAAWLAAHGLPFLDAAADKPRADALTKRWDQALLAYCFVASVAPMWLLLQPRGLIGAAFLYATLAFGIVGTIVGSLVGDGGDALLLSRIRAHANFAEYVPIILVVMGLIETNTGPVVTLGVIGIALVLCRIAHAVGMGMPAPNPARIVGTAGTFIILIVTSVWALIVSAQLHELI